MTEKIKLFQYGSNMDLERLKSRLGQPIKDLGISTLKGYEIAFDIHSRGNACAVTDILEKPGKAVIGRLFSIDEKLLKTMDVVEGVKAGNYGRGEITLADGRKAITYVGTAQARTAFAREHPSERPSDDYLDHLVLSLAGPLHADLKYISDVIQKARRGPAIESFEVKHTYDAPKEHLRSTIGMGKRVRDDLGVIPGQYVMVQRDGQTLYLRVSKAPHELISGDCAVEEPVTLSREARKLLGMTTTGTRDTPRYKTQFDGVTIERT